LKHPAAFDPEHVRDAAGHLVFMMGHEQEAAPASAHNFVHHLQ
jgi:hypothetical protein